MRLRDESIDSDEDDSATLSSKLKIVKNKLEHAPFMKSFYVHEVAPASKKQKMVIWTSYANVPPPPTDKEHSDQSLPVEIDILIESVFGDLNADDIPKTHIDNMEQGPPVW